MQKLTIAALLLTTLLTSSLSATVYENADTGTTEKWDIYDTDPAGATIENINDVDRNSNVSQLLSL